MTRLKPAQIEEMLGHPSDRGLSKTTLTERGKITLLKAGRRNYYECGWSSAYFINFDYVDSQGKHIFDPEAGLTFIIGDFLKTINNSRLLPSQFRLKEKRIERPALPNPRSLLYVDDPQINALDIDESQRFEIGPMSMYLGHELILEGLGFIGKKEEFEYRFLVGGDKPYNDSDPRVHHVLRAYANNLRKKLKLRGIPL